MKLSDIMLTLKQDSSGITTNPLLEGIDIEFLRKMECNSQNHKGLKELLVEMNSIAESLQVEDIEHQKDFYSKYSEAKFYVYFKYKREVPIELVPRQTEIKTPDFGITFDGQTFYGEVKSFLMAGGNLNYKRTLNEGLQSRIDAEDEIRQGKCVGSGIQVIQPHLRNEKTYDSSSVKLVIDNLIVKFDQNFKEEQYSQGATISLIYLNSLNFPLYGLGSIKQKILPIYLDDSVNSPVSGELWWAAFGLINNFIWGYSVDSSCYYILWRFGLRPLTCLTMVL